MRKTIGIDMYSGLALSCCGDKHRENNKQSQDASLCKITESYAIAAVADGHGGFKYFRSGVGAQIAVEVAIQRLTEFLENHEYIDALKKSNSKRDVHLNAIKCSIIDSWQDKIREHYDNNSLSTDEISLCEHIGINSSKFKSFYYGTTLLLACMTNDYSVVAQIGDGQITIVDKNIHINQIQKDENLFFGLTTSLCDSNAIINFKHTIYDDYLKCIILASDGFSDSLNEDAYTKFVNIFLENHENDREITELSLKEWLPIVSMKGSRDDVSIGIIYRCNDS